MQIVRHRSPPRHWYGSTTHEDAHDSPTASRQSTTTQHDDIPRETLYGDGEETRETETDPTHDTIPVGTGGTGYDTGQPAAGHIQKRT